ncbi:co-chaperone HscB [Paraferrimonas haliotis]|uniref:co-chaperone HscB n=1 Tax=Paraferrimonas haliotis TaxID=2013866 RepID=UPI000BA995A9|nr:co-chaperone HscB [Paraferrimonas haliotis]
MNYFELFNIPQSFDVDAVKLADSYRELQRAVHPDKFANASEQEKRLSVQKAAQINDGYQTIKTPIARAEHLLVLSGVTLADESETMKDMSFLMQQMSWREAMEDAEHGSDPFDAIDALYDDFSKEQAQMTKDLATALQQNNAEANQHSAMLVRKLKFMAKLVDELSRLEDKLSDK